MNQIRMLDCPVCDYDTEVDLEAVGYEGRVHCERCASILQLNEDGGYGPDGNTCKWWLTIVEARHGETLRGGLPVDL